ncbi:MAG: hypothetical protein QM758_26940 [Armatimonas sp.]
MPPDAVKLLLAAIALVTETPGYGSMGADLRQRWESGKLRLEPIDDRGTTSFNGIIRIGPETLADGPVATAATLVHEHFHTTQFPLSKTVSFWSGVITQTPVWQRLERPAYRAAVAYLEALAQSHPNLAAICHQEINATRSSFETFYRAVL